LSKAGHSLSFTGFILLFQALVDLVVLLNVPYARQVVGAVYLTLIPGLVILKALSWDEGDLSEVILYSVGLSLVMLMLIGLLLNELTPMVGITHPLSLPPILLATNIIVLLPCLLGSLKNGRSLALSGDPLYHLAPFFVLPFLSVLGVYAVNNLNSNLVLLLTLILIVAMVSLGVISKKVLPNRLYPAALLAISIALLFHSSLITNYIIGWDIHSEYNVFELTNDASHWNSALVSFDDRIAKGNGMLSVTVLPTMYSKVTSLDGSWIFKVVFPGILAFVPLALYKLYSARMRKEVAFLSVFFLISNLAFFSIDGFPAKQMVAELFYVLLFIVLLENRLSTFKRSFLFILFGIGLVVSHYSLSYIFLFLILAVWLLPIVGRFFYPDLKRSSKIDLGTVLVIFTLAFAWYIFSSAAVPFEAVTEVGEQISHNFFLDFFNPLARTTTVLRGLPGAGEASSLGHLVGRIFFYITEFFIVVGVARMLFKKETKSLGNEYAMLSYMNLLILIMGIALPNFARYFRMERFLQISLLFLAPFCVMGGEATVTYILKKRVQGKALSLIALVLVPFFLFETGFLYEVAGDSSYSLSLSGYRMDKIMLYSYITDSKEVAAAQWVSEQLNVSDSMVYGDYISTYHVLTSYGGIPGDYSVVLSNVTEFSSNGYVFLRRINLIEGKMVALGLLWNASEISKQIESQNVVYSNGDCEILGIIPENP